MNPVLSTIQYSNSNDNVVIGDKQFEVGSVEWSDPAQPNEGEATIHFLGRYEGYWLKVGFERGVKSGKGVLYRPNGSILLEACFVNGVCEGEVVERAENGEMILKYELKNGVKNGYVFGYEGAKVSRIELVEEGVLKWKCLSSNSMSGYWDVYGVNNELLFTCERSDDLKEMNGICYEYEGEKVLKRKCVYENNEMKRVLCEWKENVMVVYREDGSRLYEGGFVYASSGYVRNGFGREYGDDGNSVIYSGDWKEGKRSGHGVWYKNGDDIVTYDGEWLNDVANGEGSLFDENGELLYKGEWVNGVLRVGDKAVEYRSGEETTVSVSSIVVMESTAVVIGMVSEEKGNDDSTHINENVESRTTGLEEQNDDYSCWDSDRCIFNYYDGRQFAISLVNYGYTLYVSYLYNQFLSNVFGTDKNVFLIGFSIISAVFLLFRQSWMYPFDMITLMFLFLLSTFYFNEPVIMSIVVFVLGVPVLAVIIELVAHLLTLILSACCNSSDHSSVGASIILILYCTVISEMFFFSKTYVFSIGILSSYSAFVLVIWHHTDRDGNAFPLGLLGWTYFFFVQLSFFVTESFAFLIVSVVYGAFLIVCACVCPYEFWD